MLSGKTVSIAGTIELYQGKPEINIIRADQIKVLDSQTERWGMSFAEASARPFIKATQRSYFAHATPPEGSRKYFGSLLVGYYGPDGLLFAGRVGTGYSEKVLVNINAQWQKLRRATCPFINLPEKTRGRWGLGITPAVMKRCHWVKPVLVAQVKFIEWILDDQLRQPVFLGLLTDKEARRSFANRSMDDTSYACVLLSVLAPKTQSFLCQLPEMATATKSRRFSLIAQTRERWGPRTDL
jgi:hypothetical protein